MVMAFVWTIVHVLVRLAFMVLLASRSVCNLAFRRATLLMAVVCLDDVSVRKVLVRLTAP